MLPLDLHVLSLSLAFILSQDQTLRCSNCFMSLLKIPLFPGSSILLTVFILNTCTTVVYVNFSKNSYQSFLSKRGAKVRIFIFIFQIFSKVFFDLFFRKLLSERLQDIRLDLPTSSLGISISEFPNLSFIMSPPHLPHLARLRVQKYCCITYSPNVSPTFFNLFFTFIDCQWFTNALFSVLLASSLSYLFSLPKFSIFNPPFSIDKKPAYFYQFTPAFQQYTPAFSLFMPIFLKQLNENRFRSSLDLLSIPVYLDWYSSIIYLLLP